MRIIVAALTFLVAAPAAAQDRVIGLLELPTVLGIGPCVPFEAKPVAVYAGPNRSRVIGSLQVDKPWTPHPQGGCTEAEVSLHQGKARHPLPTREVGYEMRAAIALEERNGWIKIRLAKGAGWLAPSPRHEFVSFATLLLVYTPLTALTDEFKGQLLRRTPGGEAFGTPLDDLAHVRVTDVRQLGTEYWVGLDVMSHSGCDGNIDREPYAVSFGWVPAHAANGEPNVWFFSRGC
jgi:hypothetical protein